MKEKFEIYKDKYKSNPAWYWLLATVFLFFLLPEYISPFILFAAFIIFKRQWTKEGRLAKVGNIGKIEMVFMGYMLISTFWSPTKLDTLGCAGLWWGMFLIQVMIFNLARTKERIKKIITAIVIPAAINSVIGVIQLVTFVLFKNGLIKKEQVLITPVYRLLDNYVYKKMPFKILLKFFDSRASGFFSNPNLLASFLLAAFPLAIYLFLNASTKKSRNWYFVAVFCICCGMGSTLTRAGLLIIIAAWLILFIIFCRKHIGKMLLTAIPTLSSAIPALMIRYGKIIIYPPDVKLPGPDEALKSSEAHFTIWKCMIHFITHNWNVFVFGTGFGCENTGFVLANIYLLNKPHSHNVIIEIWVELGVIGIAMLAFILIYAAGKLLEIDTKSFKALTLVFSLLVSLGSFFVFGLSDYIFNSPKQIIIFMILLGLIQATSYVYEKHEIRTPSDLSSLAKSEIDNIINQD